MDSERLPRAGRLEILGAWLHVWTPPRDTYVPPPPPLRAQVGRYECLASTGSLVLGTQKQVTSGYPFWVRIFFTSGRFAWCKINPQAGEGVAGTGGQITVPLAPVCDLTH